MTGPFKFDIMKTNNQLDMILEKNKVNAEENEMKKASVKAFLDNVSLLP